MKFYFENSKFFNDDFLWKFILKIQKFQNSLIDQDARLREETDWERGPIDFAVYTQYEGEERHRDKNFISGNRLKTYNHELVGWVVLFDTQTRLGIQDCSKVNYLKTRFENFEILNIFVPKTQTFLSTRKSWIIGYSKIACGARIC